MKQLLLIPVFLISFFFLRAQNNAVSFPFEKLAGKWSMATRKGTITEEWQKIDSATLSGKSYLMKNQDTILLEKLLIHFEQGKLLYTSVVKDQNNGQAVSFTLTASENNIYTFENLLHDFPKRIHYEFINEESLHAWIDGGEAMHDKRSDFNYARIKN